MKSPLIKALIFYILSMIGILYLKPNGLYYPDNKTFKSWKNIDLNNPDTFCNIYVYSVIIAIVSYYLANEN